MNKDITNTIKKVINHLVLFKVKQDSSPEQIDDFLKGLKSLRSISGVIWAEGGKQEIMFPNSIDRSAGYNYMLLVTLNDRKSLESYDKDPYHLMVKEKFILPLIDKSFENPILAFDWEVEGPPLFDRSSSKYLSIGIVSLVAVGAIICLRSMI